jgi:hypothetical protein
MLRQSDSMQATREPAKTQRQKPARKAKAQSNQYGDMEE